VTPVVIKLYHGNYSINLKWTI